MTREQIFRELTKRYTNHDQGTLKEVAYNLSLVGTPVEASLWDRADRAIQNLQAKKASNVLEAETRKSKHKDCSTCPLCKQPMRLVKLLEDRQVAYCPDHRVTEPLPVSEE